MTDQPYTDADVKRVEQAILHAEAPIRPGYINGPYQLTAEARAALDALAAAGRLLPAGTKTVEQPGIRIRRDGVVISEELVTREQAQIMVQSYEAHRATNPEWRGSAELIHRYQHTTPWEPVSEVTP